ncbi:2-polyprenyl-6-methoxyphenol hydroxylase [Brachybacterium ginsengisoli]|uniref:2-polyprenyl-6-methoxyphenol hydroxylase n=1 Tax=Brachybacterium ginsengisoli TaxID=1331682 RepID=A0A291GUC8_9MICO|nr:FAD-dependent monooxygenase [Brachybacterium ginsengisoli]ATG53694.1 2-polyprenyl-6-methoxyphenol hydroxylase [Brachybacterium ginsengisoli]
MDVILIGGGIAGLALAHQLAPDHRVTVLEASPGPRGGGYMIDFFGPGYLAAERMGIIDALRSRGHVFEGVRYGTPDGAESGRIDVGPLVAASGGRYFSILRPEVELGLLAVLPDTVDLRYGARAVAVRDADLVGAGSPRRAVVELADGATLESDLVVACDGVRSVVRGQVAPGHGGIVPMGYRVASYLYQDPQLAEELGERMLMTDTVRRVGWVYSAGGGRVGAMFAERTDAALTERPVPDRSRLQREFAGLHPQVDRALAHAPESFYDDLVAQAVAPCWSRGRIALAGDAAHAPSLLAGQGTSLAIAGAEALARSLRAAGPHVEVGLTEYERRWRPTVEAVQRAGRRSASFFAPANRAQLRFQQIARRAVTLPGAARLAARRFVAP